MFLRLSGGLESRGLEARNGGGTLSGAKKCQKYFMFTFESNGRLTWLQNLVSGLKAGTSDVQNERPLSHLGCRMNDPSHTWNSKRGTPRTLEVQNGAPLSHLMRKMGHPSHT